MEQPPILNEDLSAVQTGREVKQPLVYAPNIVTNLRAWRYDLTTWKEVWVMTYTVGENTPSIWDSVTRLICTKPPTKTPRHVEVRLASNLHAKLYLCWPLRHSSSQRARPITNPRAYVGSLNFGRASLVELLVRIDSQDTFNGLKLFYEDIWNQLAP